MDIVKPLLDAIRQIVREELAGVPHVKDEKWINTSELCEYLGVSQSWVSHRIKQMPHIEGPNRFKKSEVDAWLKSQVEVDEMQIKVNEVKKKVSKEFKVV